MIDSKNQAISDTHSMVPMKKLIFLLCVLLISMAPQASSAKSKTHYEVLGLKQDASLKDIKKAYRSLAVQHHPDRNLGNEEEATIKFREISEAYEILSDENSRRQYDKMLRYGGAGGASGFAGRGNNARGDFKHRDPFAQFNDVFKNDPFFAEARKSMDDLFDHHFSSFAREADAGKESQRNSGGGGGIWNTIKRFMPDIQIESSVTMGGSTSHTSRSYSNSRTTSSYTSKSTSTTIENGQRVTVQSMEKDGNRIEEKYIGKKLIERKINGHKQNIERIAEF